jgi:hypothetical protein
MENTLEKGCDKMAVTGKPVAVIFLLKKGCQAWMG